MKLNDLTKGEKFIVDWQYRMGGSFCMALVEVIGRADIGNLAKLKKGFPDEVEAFENYTQVSGWWESLKEKIQKED